MAWADQYRARAAELHAEAKCQTNQILRADLENLARVYLLLAEQADRNSQLDGAYEAPPPKLDEPKR